MIFNKMNKVERKLKMLHADAVKDFMRIKYRSAIFGFGPPKPEDFELAYLPISKEQGHFIRNLIVENNCQHVVEFGTSFGISTIYLADAVRQTGGKVITTELLPGKAHKAMHNIEEAGLGSQVTFKVGDAMETLRDHAGPIDFLLLDGWKDLYLPLFKMLERHFDFNTLIYADNMDMAGTQAYADFIQRERRQYATRSLHGGKAFLTRVA